jgi:ATP-dependent helicase/DNAse subunit B
MRERLSRGSSLTDRIFEHERDFPALMIEEEPASGIAWPSLQNPGGQDVLKRQAACPFQAFAVYRLGATELGAGDWGLDAKDRGHLLHKVLEGIWGELKDRDSLIQAGQEGRLRHVIQRQLIEALKKYRGPLAHRNAAGNEDSWGLAYLQAEQDRVMRLIEEWLAFEQQRTPFAVEKMEEKLTARVGELELHLRADRIDTVEGGRLLIDYKSGKVKSSAWEGGRPDEPQLPLYAAFGKIDGLRGALLAQIRSGDLKFFGTVDDPELNPCKSTFPGYTLQLQQQWKAALELLGQQFSNGEAQVDPKKYPTTCTYCGLPGLCRVAETDRAMMDMEAPEGESDNGGD